MTLPTNCFHCGAEMERTEVGARCPNDDCPIGTVVDTEWGTTVDARTEGTLDVSAAFDQTTPDPTPIPVVGDIIVSAD